MSSFTFACTAGMRVMPPTRTTWSIFDLSSSASASACFVGATVRSSRSAVISSSFARVSCRSRCFGPSAVAVTKGRLICVVIVDDSSIFAFSAASYRRWSAILSAARSMPWSFLNSPTIQSTTALSKLSPPRWLSPAVDFTSKTPPPSSSTDTSNVPPPRSKTRIVWSTPSLSRPYASAAAVGSLMIRSTLRPAILPASFVASRCALLKYAGTVMTASSTDSPRYASASDLSFWRIIALISGGGYSLPSASTRTSPFGPLSTSYGTIFISSETSGYGAGWVDAALGLLFAAILLGALGGQRPKRARKLAVRLAADRAPVTAELRALLDDRATLAVNYLSALLVLAVIALMVFKPGATHS